METILPTGKLLLFTGVFLAVCILVIVAIMLDLVDGVHTARKTGQRVRSHILRKTIEKMCEYWRFIMIGFLVDCLGIFFGVYLLPFVAMLFGGGLIMVEIKSLFEHARRRRSHATQLPEILRGIVDCTREKDAREIMRRIAEMATAETVKTKNIQ